MTDGKPRSDTWVVPINAGLLFLLALAAFSRTTDRLFTGFDGLGFRIVVPQLFHWQTLKLGLSGFPIEGSGGLYFLNVHLIPTLAALGALKAPFAVPLAYALAAIELYLATYLLGRALGFSNVASVIAGWLLALVTLPFFEFALIYPFTGITTNFSDALAYHTAALAFFAFALNGSWVRRALATTGLGLLALWSIAAQPTYIILFIPASLGGSLAMVMALPDWRSRLLRPLLPLLALATIIALGGGVYLFGLFADTASAFFRNELNQAMARAGHMISIALQWQVTDWSGLVLFASAMIGFVLSLREADGQRRAFIVACMAAPVLLIVAAFLASERTWVYPIPVYFEFALWPVYALYAATLIAPLVVCSFERVRRTTRACAIFIFVAMAAAAAAVLHFQPTLSRNDIWGRTPAKDAITSVVAQNIALTQPGPFRGYASTFMGYDGGDGPPADWAVLLTHGLKVTAAIGNPLRLIGLWYYDIPTLEDYQPITSPTHYAVFTRLLARSIDKQWRNVFVLTNPRLGLLEALGVRYVVADTELTKPAVQRVQLSVEGLPPIQLYELEDPNLGHYSPTEVLRVDDAASALSAMAEPEFDFRRRVVTFADVEGPLLSASAVRLEVERGGYIVKASSAGRSFLLLPLQYSLCLKVTAQKGARPQLIRANLAQIGLIFEGEIEVHLSQSTGLFDRPSCRWNDAQQLRKLGLGASAP